MKNILYYLVKIWVRAGLYLYFGQIKVSGIEKIPVNKPLILLPNHQNALLDALLIAVNCNRKPYFLTRSDVFKNNFLKNVFGFFRMIPIYRIRDGRNSLANNQHIFDQCSHLLQKEQAILIFPEANHNIKRRVRVLSKGFTRIILNTLENQWDIDIQLVPTGLNYRSVTTFPDRVAIYYGKAIAVQDLLEVSNIQASTNCIKNTISAQLKLLTTHIENEVSYEPIIEQLKAKGVNYLDPAEVNNLIPYLDTKENKAKNDRLKSDFKWYKALMVLFNLPIFFVWRAFIKPTIKEPEFLGTMRFACSMFLFPIYFVLLFIVLQLVWNTTSAVSILIGIFVFNWAYVKLVKG